MLDLLRERGLLKARGKQRTDSTHVIAAIRTLNRLTGVGETLRHALNGLAALAPSWLQAQITPDWFDRYSRRMEEYHLPKATTDRLALAATIGADGFELLTALYAPSTPGALRDLAAVQILRQVWVQQYYAPEPGRPVRWREEADSPPPPQRIHSPYDPEARYSSKGSINWVGYKVHLTEECDDDAPHVITHVLTTLATTPDDAVTATIHHNLATHDLLPTEHLVDSGYTDADLLVTSRTQHTIDLVGPLAVDGSWQAKAAQGYDLSQFAVDWEAQRVTCPQGKQSVAWRPCVSWGGQNVVKVRFRRGECAICSSRSQCTTAKTKPREVTLRPQAEHAALQAARQRQSTVAFKLQYARRAGVESLISQGVRAGDLRHTRYIGLARTHLQQILMAVGITLVRVVAWLQDPAPSPKRQAHFAALAPTG
jgi:transposase